MHFLDILLCKSGNRILTDLYHKSTDKNTVLHGKSSHPPALLRNVSILNALEESVALIRIFYFNRIL